MLGIAPSRLPAGWVLEPFADLAQMHCDDELAVIGGPDIIELDESHRADVLALPVLFAAPLANSANSANATPALPLLPVPQALERARALLLPEF